MAVESVNKTKKNIKRLRKIFRVLSLFVKVVFVPVLIFSCLVVITHTTTKNYFGVPSAFGYSKVSLETEELAYAKNVDASQIQVGQQVIFFNVTNDDPKNPIFTIEKRAFQALEFNEGNAEIRLDGADFLIPANNIIGVEVEEIPAFVMFFITNFSDTMEVFLAAILPIVLLVLVFIFDTMLYFKDRQEANKNLVHKVIKNENLTAQEQVNLSNFEAVKVSIMSANKKDEEQKPAVPMPPKPSFSSKTIPSTDVPKRLPPKNLPGVHANIKAAPNAENIHLGKAKPPVMPNKPAVPQPPKSQVLPPKKPE